MAIKIIQGDSEDELKMLPSNSVHSIVTDPPAGIAFMGKSWDTNKGGRDKWISWLSRVMKEALRVLKPGGYALVWALPRTSHWTAMALELAGFEVCDRVSHLFGTGFPKGENISKAIDKHLGAKRTPDQYTGPNFKNGVYGSLGRSPAATPEAAAWEGWNTALKPACEDWWLVQKPFKGTYTANVLQHGTGGLNIDGCRIGDGADVVTFDRTKRDVPGEAYDLGTVMACRPSEQGRWPAHVVLDEAAAAVLDASVPATKSPRTYTRSTDVHSDVVEFNPKMAGSMQKGFGDAGGPSRFFYVAKPAPNEKHRGVEKNDHPTVKSLALMRWLITLVTPKGGTVLDMFAGSGTTLLAASELGFDAIGIEQSAHHVDIIQGRYDNHVSYAEMVKRDEQVKKIRAALRAKGMLKKRKRA